MYKKIKCFIIIVLVLVIKLNAQNNNYFRIAKIIIDSTKINEFKLALKEGIQSALRLEKGVLSLYAFYDKNNPTNITVFEIYLNEDAYKSHIKTEHFIKYKNKVVDIVKSLQLTDVLPIE